MQDVPTRETTLRSRLGRRGGRDLVAVVSAAVLVVAALVAPVVPAAPASAAATLPSGFVLQDLATGMTPPSAAGPGDLLTDLAYLPDESIIATGKYGRVQWVPKVGAPRQLAALTGINASGDLGLLSVAVAPDYATSRTIYTAEAYTSTAPGSGANGILRLSRWTVSVDANGLPTGLTNERAVFETSADSNIHSVGSIALDADGTIWFSIGDSATNAVTTASLRALDVGDVHGKLLRLTTDGAGASTNPFYDAAAPRAARSLVYASGLRSPFRFSFDPVTGLPVLGDVGKNTTEEVDLMRPGYSYGWPCWEGSQPTAGFKDMAQCVGVTTTAPIWEYPHNGSGAAVVGGVVYTGTTYPAQYRGRYFVGDYVDQIIWTLGFSSSGVLTQAPETNGFGTGIGRPSRFETGPGGDIVYADIGSATIRRLVYAPGNAAPTAAFTNVPDPSTLTVAFDASTSSDPNNDLLTYSWDFGDGTTGTGVTPTHHYAASPDRYDVTLTVTDPLGAASSTTHTVRPGNHPPTLTTHWPDPAMTYAVGDVVHASAEATDTEDGALSVAWSSRIEHCYSVNDCHTHYGVTGTGPTFDLSVDGHEGDTTLWITAAATDSSGAFVSEDFKVVPRQHLVTIVSTWPAAFTMGDESLSSGRFTEGQVLSLVAPTTGYDGVSQFHAWGDGDTSRFKDITVGTTDMTITVEYRTPIDTRLATDAAFATRLGAPTGVEQGTASLRSRTFTRGVAHWSPGTGVHYVAGAIGAKYAALGGPAWCGPPTTDELRSVGGTGGYYNDFAKACSIYWTSSTGAHWLNGYIRSLWVSMGREQSRLGYPTSDLAATAGRTGYLTHFQGGSIWWSGSTGAHWTAGGIRSKYLQVGAERSFLRYPTTNVLTTASGLGRYQHFQGGSIWWSSGTGAHPVSGAIRTTWSKLGWERSWLGYPVGDMYAVTVGARQNFQHGYLVWNRSTGVVSATRY